MASTLRRNTYVVGGNMPTPLIPLKQPDTENSRKDRQNLMRLKVNRIALIQEVKVENIIPFLIEKCVLTTADKQRILSGSASQDKTRILLDLLPNKKKETEWYKHFRDSLMNPHGGTEVKKRYRLLVEFLDNTFIQRPASSKLPISKQDENVENLNFPKYKPLPEIPEAKNLLNDDIDSSTMIKEDRRISSNQEIIIKNVLLIEKSPDQTSTSLIGEENHSPETGSEDKLTWSLNSRDSILETKGLHEQRFSKHDNFSSQISMPESLHTKFKGLSSDKGREHLNHEYSILKRVQSIEKILYLKKENQLPQGSEICMCEPLIEILNEPDLYHCYVKYARDIKTFLHDIVLSYSSVLTSLVSSEQNEIKNEVISHGFHLSDFLLELSFLTLAGDVITLLANILAANPKIETLIPCYKALVKLTHIRNENYDFIGAEQAYFKAVQITWKIQLVSFGQDLVEEGDLMLEMSHYQLQQGALSAGYGWAKRALQEFSPQNHKGIINALCNAVMAYSGKWQIRKAGELAMQAVTQARKHFGKDHPLYLKALLHLCHFTSEFVHQDVALQVAEMTLDVAEKMYGCQCLQVAYAHRAVSKALMVLQKFDSDAYYFHAMEAVRIARSIFQENHPILYVFLHTFSSALQWKALNSPEEVQNSTLHWAEVEAKQALKIAKSCYGDLSLRTAQVYSLLGQIYSKMTSHPEITNDLIEEAEEYLKKCVRDMKLCQPLNSQYYLLALATLGTFYKILHRPKEAVVMLSEALKNIENQGFYQRWIHECYENLLACYEYLEDTESARETRQHMNTWLDANPYDSQLITVTSLDSDPPSYEQFIEAFDLWGSKMKRVKNQLVDTRTQ